LLSKQEKASLDAGKGKLQHGKWMNQYHMHSYTSDSNYWSVTECFSDTTQVVNVLHRNEASCLTLK